MKQPGPPVEERPSLSDLVDHIRSQLRLLLREEIQLAKTEMSEKLSRLRRNLLLIVAGAVSAYVGGAESAWLWSSWLWCSYRAAGVVHANNKEAFITAAKTRQWGREKSVRTLE